MAEKKVLKTVALLSGGLDSVVNLKKASDETDVLLALTFNYGQRSAAKEVEASAGVAGLLEVPHKVVDLPWLAEITQTALVDVSKAIPSPDPSSLDDESAGKRNAASVWVPNRNAVFTAVGAAYAESYGAHAVVAGFNAEEGRVFPDNSIEFISAVNRVLSLSTLNRCKILSFTSSMEKADIVRLGLDSGAPLEKIWSCYRGGEEHCGACESCRRLERALRAAGRWEWFVTIRRREV